MKGGGAEKDSGGQERAENWRRNSVLVELLAGGTGRSSTPRPADLSKGNNTLQVILSLLGPQTTRIATEQFCKIIVSLVKRGDLIPAQTNDCPGLRTSCDGA